MPERTLKGRIMVKTPTDNEKKAARNEKRAARLMEDAPDKPALTVVGGASNGKATRGMKGEVLRTRELIEMVAASTGRKKAEVAPMVEAVLEAVGIALATGKDLHIPPLGKLRIAKNQPPVMTLKLRLADGPKAAGLALADEDEDS